jgi:adenine-specific DNA methylase
MRSKKIKKVRNQKFLIFVIQEQKLLFYHLMYQIIIQKAKINIIIKVIIIQKKKRY